jgi:hypothetical protein
MVFFFEFIQQDVHAVHDIYQVQIASCMMYDV